MQKINFQNLPSTSTPLNATNLNQMQDNIENAIDIVAGDIPTVVDSLSGSSTTDAPSVHAVNEKIDTITAYSTTETIIGKMGNKLVYRKMVETTALPNTGQLTYQTGITNFGDCLNVYGWTSGGLMLNAIRPNSPTFAVGAWCNTNGLYIETGSDRSSQTATAIIEYTKTTD